MNGGLVGAGAVWTVLHFLQPAIFIIDAVVSLSNSHLRAAKLYLSVMNSEM
jgi:hypothetical protein